MSEVLVADAVALLYEYEMALGDFGSHLEACQVVEDDPILARVLIEPCTDFTGTISIEELGRAVDDWRADCLQLVEQIAHDFLLEGGTIRIPRSPVRREDDLRPRARDQTPEVAKRDAVVPLALWSAVEQVIESDARRRGDDAVYVKEDVPLHPTS